MTAFLIITTLYFGVSLYGELRSKEINKIKASVYSIMVIYFMIASYGEYRTNLDLSKTNIERRD